MTDRTEDMRRGLCALALLALLALAAAPAIAGNLHYSLLDEPARPFPARLVLLPPQVTVKEVAAGGIMERVPEWTRWASDNIREELLVSLGWRPEFTLLPMPALTAAEQERVEQYLASCMVVGIAAHWATTAGGSAWAHKRSHFDYTLGEGLAFLRERTGADAALLVIAEDYVSSSGRKAARLLGALVGLGIPGGQAIVSVGVIDLHNGDLRWLHHSQSGSKDLKDREAVRQMLSEALATLPAPGPVAAP